MNYYDDDPKKGGKRISFWRYLQISGMLNDFKKAGYTINPTHNCEMLIPVRNAIFEKVKGQFIDERSLNELKTTNYDLSQLYSLWLEKELEVIKGWLSKIYPNGDKKKVMHSISEQLEISKYKKYVIDEITKINNTPPTIETKTGKETVQIKPVLKPEAVQIIFEIIKYFFNPEQQTELKQVLQTGNKASKKMLFKGNGNRLTDTFKKLIEHDFITGCQKQDLINWIVSNFNFTQQNKVKEFVYDTVEKTISRNNYPCKSPFIEIKNGQIQKVEHSRAKKYSKY